MTTAGFPASAFICSNAGPSVVARGCRNHKFPAKYLSGAIFGGKAFVVAASASSTSTVSASLNNASNESCGHASLCKRRGFSFLATTPFILESLNLIGGASAADDILVLEGEIRKVLTKAKAAGVLRLAFHDAGTFEMDQNSGGMNGSIVYELERPENGGLKKSVKILAKAKSEVEKIRPVSWADMIAVAGAEAVSVCGGPKIPVQLGRIDSEVPDAEGKLPEESLDANGLRQCFQRKGFSTQELVALSGAHTLGSKGFGNPTIFDNSYFKILLEKPWLSSAGMSSMIGLPSDRALVEDEECARWISKYADNEQLFFADFKNAYIKLVNSGATWKKSLWLF